MECLDQRRNTHNVKMSVMLIKIRSLKPHFGQLEARILSLEFPPNILCLTETWITGNDLGESY